MKRQIIYGGWFMLFVLFIGCKSKSNKQEIFSQVTTNDSIITIVNWNIEWFGSSSEGSADKDLQERNALTVLKYLHADIYGVCEIVDILRLQKLVKAMGHNYAYVVSGYASSSSPNHSKNYDKAQKLAFIYNKNVCSNVKAQAILTNNSNAGYNFAGGRFPYMFQADIIKDGVTKHISLFLIHAKSGADKNSFTRRVNASVFLKSYLDKNFANESILVLGDFNDELDKSISRNEQSPYRNFIVDNNYACITLPLNSNGSQSTLDYNSVIDQQIISSTLNKFYIPNSAKVRKDIVSVVSDFPNGKTSDHYPVSSSYNFKQISVSNAATDNITKDAASALKVLPDSTIFNATLQPTTIDIVTSEDKDGIQFVLYNQNNDKIVSVHKRHLNSGEVFHLRTPQLSNGNYDLVIYSGKVKQVVKLLKE